MGLYDFSFYDLINRNAVAFGSCVCWLEVDDGRQLTFSEYKHQVDLLAFGLTRAGIQKGDRIGVVGKNSLEFFLVYGAAAFLGAIVLPINWRLSADEVCFNLNDCRPKILFADAEFQPMMEAKRNDLPSVEAYYNLKSDLGDASGISVVDGGVRSDDRPANVASYRRFCHYSYGRCCRTSPGRASQSWQYAPVPECILSLLRTFLPGCQSESIASFSCRRALYGHRFLSGRCRKFEYQ